MKKKVSPKQKSQLPLILVTTGLLLLALTPFVSPVSYSMLIADCVKNPYGRCPLDVSFPASALSIQLAIAFGVVGLIILSVGAYLYYRRAK